MFPQAIRSAIEGSDAFLFVITPDSVTSTYCDQEVTYALELEKRIVPVLHIAVPDDDAPEEIRHRNWIPFTDRDDSMLRSNGWSVPSKPTWSCAGSTPCG